MQKIGVVWQVILPFIGAFLMGVLLSFGRYCYYIFQGIEPNMSPIFFVIFSPVVSSVFGFFGMAIEVVLNKVLVNSKSKLQSFLYGTCYALPLLYLIDWRLLFVMVVANPIVLRYLFNGMGNRQ